MSSASPTIPGYRRPAQSAPRPVPRLDVRGPLLGGIAIAVLFFTIGLGGAALAPIDKGVGLGGTLIVESRVRHVQHQRGGTIGRLHVSEGEEVKAGQLLVSLDTIAIDEQIAALKAQADSTRKQLTLLREETQTMSELLERKLAARSRVLALERQVAEIEKERAGLASRIAIAEQELARAEIRSPVSGRVLTIAAGGQGTVIQPGQTVMDIVPQSDRLVIEGRLSPGNVDNVHPGMDAKIWLTTLSWRESRPLAGKLVWISPDTVEDRRTGIPHYLARVELADPDGRIARRHALHPGMRTEMLLLTGQRTLLDQILDPLLRNINRAFRA